MGLTRSPSSSLSLPPFPPRVSPISAPIPVKIAAGLDGEDSDSLVVVEVFLQPALFVLEGSVADFGAFVVMAKRELSSTLRNLKFMQRAANAEVKAGQKDKEDAPVVKSEADVGNFASSASVTKRCVVIMEGDPHPGAVIGRMSFQSFNPVVDKMNGITTDINQPEAEAEIPSTSAAAQKEKASLRENTMAMNEEDGMDFKEQNSGGSSDLKRKQSPVADEMQYPNNYRRNRGSDQGSSAAKDRSSNKRPKKEKLDWSILRPSKGQKQ